MRRTFCYSFIFLLYLEIILHFACYQNITGPFLILVLLFNVGFSFLMTLLCSAFSNSRINGIIFKALMTLIIIIYIAELIYYKIYGFYFSYKGLLFIGAVKDGFDKVLKTIGENIIFVILFILPLIFIYSKHTKNLTQMNMKDVLTFTMFVFLFQLYSVFIIDQVNKDEFYSLYNLYYKMDVPLYNVENFGFLTATRLSLQREITHFKEEIPENEDILSNTPSVLAGVTKLEYNKMDIDFNTLIANEQNGTIKSLHEYFAEEKPTVKNAYTGMFKDKNVILILAESLDKVAIDPVLTPTLYKMTQEGIFFENYYTPTYPAGTADGEYMVEWGLFPIIGNDYSLIDMVYNRGPYILPNVFKSLGYTTYAYHNYYGYYNYRNKYFSALPWDVYKFGTDMDLYMEKFHGSDLEMMEKSVGDFVNQDKFFTYYITLSGHGSYDTGSNYIARKNYHLVQNLGYSSNLKGYLAANIELDRGLEKLEQSLRDSGKLDDTIIMVTSDHTPYYLSGYELNTRSQIDRVNKFGRNQGICFLWNSKLPKPIKVDKYGMNVDLLPTILNLIGYPYDSRLLMGTDLLASGSGIAILSDRSWINEYGSYDNSKGVFYQNDGVQLGEQYISSINQAIAKKFQVSTTMQYEDYYKYLFQ